MQDGEYDPVGDLLDDLVDQATEGAETLWDDASDLERGLIVIGGALGTGLALEQFDHTTGIPWIGLTVGDHIPGILEFTGGALINNDFTIEAWSGTNTKWDYLVTINTQNVQFHELLVSIHGDDILDLENSIIREVEEALVNPVPFSLVNYEQQNVYSDFHFVRSSIADEEELPNFDFDLEVPTISSLSSTNWDEMKLDYDWHTFGQWTNDVLNGSKTDIHPNRPSLNDDMFKFTLRKYPLGGPGTLISPDIQLSVFQPRDKVFRDDINVRLLIQPAIVSGKFSFEYTDELSDWNDAYIYTLIWKALHDNDGDRTDGLSHDIGFYRDLISDAPCHGPYTQSGANRPARFDEQANGWFGQNRWEFPTREEDAVFGSSISGHYPGLDLMVLHNLYYLTFEDELPAYRDVTNCDCAASLFDQVGSDFNLNSNTEYELVPSTYTLLPKFPDYLEKGIPIKRYVTADMRVSGARELTVNTDLYVCNDVAVMVDESSRMVISADKQVVFKSGSSLHILDGSELHFEQDQNPSAPDVIFEDNTTLRIHSSTWSTVDWHRFEFGDNCTIEIIDSQLQFGIANNIQATNGLLCGSFVGDNASVTFQNSTLEGSQASCLSFGENCSWVSQDLSISCSYYDDPQGYLVHLGEHSTAIVQGELNLEEVTFVVAEYGELNLESGHIRISRDFGASALEIKPYANLRWHATSQLTLNDSPSVLRLGGVVKLESGASFGFGWDTGEESGYLDVPDDSQGWWAHHFEALGPGCSIQLQGQGPDDLILRMGEEADMGFAWNNSLLSPEADLDGHALIRIEDGRIDMDDQSRLILGADQSLLKNCSINFDDSRGILAFNQHLIDGCQIDGNAKVRGMMNYGGQYLRIKNSDFGGGAGIMNHHKGARISNCHFDGSEIRLLESTLPNKIQGCDFEDGAYLSVELSASTTLLNNCDFLDLSSASSDNPSVYNQGGVLIGRCSRFESTQIRLEESTMVMTIDANGGYNGLDSETQIVVDGFSDLVLDNGYNTFMPDVQGQHQIEFHDFQGQEFLCANNYWRADAAEIVPGMTWGQSYVDEGPVDARFKFFEDVGQGLVPVPHVPRIDPFDNVHAACASMDTAPGGSGNAMANDDDNRPGTEGGLKSSPDSVATPFVLTSFYFDGIPLSEAVSQASEHLEFFNDSTGNDILAIDMLSDICTQIYMPGVIENDSLIKYQLIAYQNLKLGIENAFATGALNSRDEALAFSSSVQSYVDILMLRSDSTISDDNYQEQFYLEIDKAQLFGLLGSEELSLQLLVNLDDCQVDSLEQDYLNQWIYATESEISMEEQGLGAYLNDSLALDIDTAAYISPMEFEANQYFFGTVILGPQTLAYANCGGFWHKDLSSTSSSVEIFPNPTSSIVNIQWAAEGDTPTMILVNDMNGSEVGRIDLRDDVDFVQFGLEWLSRGVYMISVMSDKGRVHVEQVVKQ